MYDEATLQKVGRAAARVLGDLSWIHRRVERVTFPIPEQRVTRRRVSIDLHIPHVPAIDNPDEPPTAETEGTFYLPVSFLEKWPPVLQLDLRDHRDAAVPLLTRVQNAVVDAAVLETLAVAVLDVQDLPDDIPPMIRQLTEAVDAQQVGGQTASAALGSLLRIDGRGGSAFEPFARALANNTLLWLRLPGKVGDRQIVKFSYDTPSKFTTLRERWRHSFGLAAGIARDPAPHLGSSGSYHLAYCTPPGLRVVDVEVVLHRPLPPLREHAPRREKIEVVSSCAAGQGVRRHQNRTLYAAAIEGDGRVYVSGDRSGLIGTVWLAILGDTQGFLRGAAVGALATFLLLAAFAIAAFEGMVTTTLEASVAVLLIAPVIIQYLLFRPSEHVLVGGLFHGLRWGLIAVGGLPVASAGILVLNGEGPPGWLVPWVLTGAALGAGVVLATFASAWQAGKAEKVCQPFSSRRG
jgi:hypothetical protein